MNRKVEIGKKGKVVVKWKVLPIDYSVEAKNDIISKVAEKYAIDKDRVSVEPVFIKKDENGNESPFTNEVIMNIQDPAFQQKLFKEFIDLKEIKDYDFDTILSIDESINNKIDYEQYTSNKRYTIKWIKWSNFMSYGSDNFFDFTKIKGLTLLTSEPANQGGKTSFCLDLFRFLLFGKVTSRESDWTLSKVFNSYLPECTEVNVEGCINIDGQDYVIKRTVTRPALKKRTEKSKVSQKVSYYKVVNDTYIALEDDDSDNGMSTTETNKIIKESIGNERDFDLMICVDADNLKGLISLKDTERGRLMARWIGLLPLEEKDKIARETFNKEIVPSLKMNMYSKDELNAIIEENKKEILSSLECIKKSGVQYNEFQKELDGLLQQRDTLLQSKTQIDENLLKVDVHTVEETINRITNEGKIKRAEKESHEKRLAEIGGVEFNEEEYVDLNNKHEKYAVSISTMQHKVSQLQKDINTLKSGEFCPTCGAKLQGVDNTEAINRNMSEIETLTNRIQHGNEIIANIDKQLLELAEKRKVYNERLQLQLIIDKTIVSLENLTARYKENKRLLKDIEDNKSAIEKNNSIEISMNLVNESIKTKQRCMDEKKELIIACRQDVTKRDEDNKKWSLILDTIANEEILVRNWKIYLEMIGKNGISKMVLRNALPLINGELSRMLDNVCDFDVEVAIDDRNDVAFYLVHDGSKRNLASGSGFEQTVASLALRSVLSRISSFSKPSFVVFDEILGGVSDENYENVKNLYDKIVKDYDSILQISHLKQIADWHSSFIVIKKENNISHIEFK